jgi:hypothetical protein
LPETVKQTQADLYLETYQVLDIEIGRLREMQRWQSSAAFKVVTTMLLDLSLSTTPHCQGMCKNNKIVFFHLGLVIDFQQCTFRHDMEC